MTIKQFLDNINFYPKWIIITNAAFDNKFKIRNMKKLYMTCPDYEIYRWQIRNNEIFDKSPSIFLEIYITDENDIQIFNSLSEREIIDEKEDNQ